jgi:hypothetical protein
MKRVLVVVIALLVAAPSAAAAPDDAIVLDRSRVTVAVTGNRVIPVRLTQPVTWDLTADDTRVAGITVDLNGAALGTWDDYGVALVTRGSTTGVVTAAMFAADGRPVLTSGQTSRIGLPRPAGDSVACIRCDVPAGDYDLFLFGPYRRSAQDPAPSITLHFEGPAAGATVIPDGAGRGAYILSFAPRSISPAGNLGGGMFSMIIPLFYDGAEREGIFLAQASVRAPFAPAGAAELTLSGQVNNRPPIGPTEERMPLQDGYAAAGGVVVGDGVFQARIAAATTLDRKTPYVYAHGDTWIANHNGWTMDLGMLWLTTRTVIYDQSAAAREPAADLQVKTW